MSLASAERAALADLLDAVGPDAPTLCAGWTTRDLAAHLVIREGRPDANAGIVVPPLAGWTHRVQERAARRDYAELVERIRTGPPTLSVFAIPGVDANANGFEFLVHHEDVRRAQPGWEPRTLPDQAVEAIWNRLVRNGARFIFRRAGTGVVVRRPDGAEVTARKGEPSVMVVGEPVEIVLQAFGRGDHAQVEVLGSPEAVAAFTGTDFAV